MSKISKERWIDIDGFSKYQASDLGNIRTKLTNRIHSSSRAVNGYIIVDLKADGETKFKSQYTHRLVGIAFYGLPKGKEINHKDGNRSNNKPNNLEWITHRENLIHKHEVLNNHTGICLDMLRLFQQGTTYKELAQIYNRSEGTVANRLVKARNYLKKCVA